MKFYNREKEITLLKKIKKQSLKKSTMTFMMGRRRIGKTKLIAQTFEKDLLYFFVAKKNETLLCEEYVQQITQQSQGHIVGELLTFAHVFEYLMQLSISKPLTLAIDEFQEFFSINPSIYSDMQNIWDRYKDKSKMNLILSGSIYSLMTKIFEHHQEPLYGRADYKIVLHPFNSLTLEEIYRDFVGSQFESSDLLALYTLTGGVAKYIELLVDQKAFTFTKMITAIVSEGSAFVTEGRDVLIEEFGKEYSTYFSILGLIANSKTSRPEMESILQKNIGGYLERLEQDFNIIQRIKPILSKPGSRTQKYCIEDNFLNFWFRFIYKNQSAIEIGNYAYVRQIVKRDFPTYSGYFLEKYFRIREESCLRLKRI